MLISQLFVERWVGPNHPGVTRTTERRRDLVRTGGEGGGEVTFGTPKVTTRQCSAEKMRVEMPTH